MPVRLSGGDIAARAPYLPPLSWRLLQISAIISAFGASKACEREREREREMISPKGRESCHPDSRPTDRPANLKSRKAARKPVFTFCAIPASRWLNLTSVAGALERANEFAMLICALNESPKTNPPH